MAEPQQSGIKDQLKQLRELAGARPAMAQTFEIVAMTQQQIIETLQQVSKLAVQVHHDLAQLEKRVEALESPPKVAGRKGRKGRRGR